MTQVYGQIESLKRLKETLNRNGITRFTSVGEIKEFIRNFEQEKKKILNKVEEALNKDIKGLDTLRSVLVDEKNILKGQKKNRLNTRINILKQKIDIIQTNTTDSKIKQITRFIRIHILGVKVKYLEKNFEKIIRKRTHKLDKRINDLSAKVNEYDINKETLIHDRSYQEIKELNRVKELVDSLNTLIVGAIGENLVEIELRKLSDRFILINDYSVKFDPPIYNRKERDKIFSIQIDHLVISPSGIFIIETKNWSKNSIENIDLGSPIKQIKRTGYALFKILNSNSNQNNLNLNKHHWGKKEIPIRKLVVMIHDKPKVNFEHVKVLGLNELNGYINYFEPVLEDSELRNIFEYLNSIMN